ncbi:MAG: hypothetical protein NTU91_06215 [Chloroflexi bacterium]|nr:hypothetical protein [Chloroflexota bacterium]
MTSDDKAIGRVTRCSTRGFVGAVRLPEPEWPVFGTFCRAEAQQGHSQVIGLIYDLSIEDDELARQLAATESLSPEQLADSQVNRQVPVEYRALAVGYRHGERFVQSLPPQPPLTLAPIHRLSDADVRKFTAQLDFLKLVIAVQEIPVDDLLAAALQTAAAARPESERRAYLVEAAAECARLVGRDLTRLESLVRSLRP